MDKNDIIEDAEWTEVNPEPNAEQNTQQEEAEQKHQYDPDWAEKSKKEIKAGTKQISEAIKYAFKEGKNDPKIKQFGEEVKTALDQIGEDISNFFN